MLNTERLPQTRHVSCGLSLTTSHSAHNTAFCRAIALRRRLLSGASACEPFITEPRKTSLTIFNSLQAKSFPPRWCYLDNFMTLQWLRGHTASIGGPLPFSCRSSTIAMSIELRLAVDLAIYRPSLRNCMTFFPLRPSCAQREFVFGFCSSPRNVCSSNRKSTSRNLDRLVGRTG